MNAPTWNAARSLRQDDDDLLTGGVLSRRCLAWCLDMILIGILVSALWFALFTFGVVTLGLGLPLLGVLPVVPFLYHFGFLASGGATPGQSVCGLAVRNNNDLAPLSGGQALVFTLAYYLTIAVSGGLLFLCAFFTIRRRALHDLLSGTVVIRTRALTAPARSWNMAGGSSFRA
ncbi:MAG: RDD family protein [Acetobacteraceae bacterium]|nr:RDD family protein [Acetobacteraceae bacterium]